jgi:hypothetical protein
MVKCPVCGSENDSFASVCTSCKAFVQAKVDTLDLFRTIWGLLESPGATFRRIALAREKNYVFALSGLFGISLVYAIMWYQNFGAKIPELVMLLGVGIPVGLLLGILLVLLFAWILTVLGRFAGGKASFRNMRAVTAYASVPVLASLVCIFPLEVAIFGKYFFDNNPPPLVMNPIVYITLLGFDALAALWSFVLLLIGTGVAAGIGRVRSVVVCLVVPALLALLVFGIPLR